MTGSTPEEQSPEKLAEYFFLESLHNHHLPENLSPNAVVEAILYPDHFPVITKLLRFFGKSGQTTPDTELAAKHCHPDDRSTIAARYKVEWERNRPRANTYTNPQNSRRLQALCVSHDPDYSRRGSGAKAFYLLKEVFAKPLRYNLGTSDQENPTGTGDLHLVVDWLIKNMDIIGPIFIRQFSVEAAAAKVAHSKFVNVNYSALNQLLDSWQSISGIVDLESARIKKPVAITSKEPFPRAGDTSISRTFRQLFIELDLTDINAVAEHFGVDTDDLEDGGLEHLAQKIQLLQLIMLSLIQDTDADRKPLRNLEIILEEPLLQALPLLLETTTANSERERQTLLTAIDESWEGRSLQQVMTALIQKTNQGSYSGFGAPQALLTRYTESKLKNDPTSDDIEKLMHLFNQIALGKSKIDLKLDQFIKI